MTPFLRRLIFYSFLFLMVVYLTVANNVLGYWLLANFLGWLLLRIQIKLFRYFLSKRTMDREAGVYRDGPLAYD